ncbi:ABC transporter ATP-binding protein [Vibrio ziniensis]|uniref:ABC transporter ATP-binding protein n=1 Tax=Vibrio ziniensis TaxID=2711221 RepID=A0A6G7CHQ8_9VIBR|nr:ABC transporter ATP-binding protein [Vibrio ziniensis]QIH41655.1 ABC transporter ATP-binding protein [Vibrio ziniensis]
MSLVIENLHKSFEGFVALERINLAIEQGEFVCLLGPSGCGKTTLLRMIAGLLPSDGGKIKLDGNDLINVPAKERGFGIVFQSYSLFPQMTIEENIGYGLKIRGVEKAQITQRVKGLLETVSLSEFGDRYPNQLSGGQQQRVAIARALAVEPSLLLLDEPLSALDAQVRAGLRQELREVQQSLCIPTLMVTHDQEEAMSMADKIVCMDRGRIVQIGSPKELYTRPANRFVAEFMGHSNLLLKDQVSECFPEILESADSNKDDQSLLIRPEYLKLKKDSSEDASVINIQFLGSIQRATISWKGQMLLAEMHSNVELSVGDKVLVSVDAKDCVWVNA